MEGMTHGHHAASLQGCRQAILDDAADLLQRPVGECCADRMRVRQRCAASCEARAAWFAAWEFISSSRLEALEQGHPYPPLILPRLELHLPEGLPEEPPPSIDRCTACQRMLDQVRSGHLAAVHRGRLQPAYRRQPSECEPSPVTVQACARAGLPHAPEGGKLFHGLTVFAMRLLPIRPCCSTSTSSSHCGHKWTLSRSCKLCARTVWLRQPSRQVCSACLFKGCLQRHSRSSALRRIHPHESHYQPTKCDATMTLG